MCRENLGGIKVFSVRESEESENIGIHLVGRPSLFLLENCGGKDSPFALGNGQRAQKAIR